METESWTPAMMTETRLLGTRLPVIHRLVTQMPIQMATAFQTPMRRQQAATRTTRIQMAMA